MPNDHLINTPSKCGIFLTERSVYGSSESSSVLGPTPTESLFLADQCAAIAMSSHPLGAQLHDGTFSKGSITDRRESGVSLC